MSTFLLVSTYILWLGITAYFRLSRLIWSPILFCLALGAYYSGCLAWGWSLILYLITFILILLTFVPPVRKYILTGPLARFFQRNLPPLSDTEKAAIEAGTVGWEAKIFQGNLNWKKLYEIPKPTLSIEEQKYLDQQVNHLCELVNDWEVIHEKAELSKATWAYIKKEKFFGMIIPKEYGGLGFSALMHSAVVSKLASKSTSLAVTVMVPNSLGPGELLVQYGTSAQKEYYLPRLARCDEIPCFALTGPEAGSDAGSIPDRGIICRDVYEGKEIIGIRLNFDKRYITLAPVATLIGVAFKLYDPEQLLGKNTTVGITLALIPALHPGVEIGARHFPLRMGFMNGPIRGKNIFIPLDWIIGGINMAGKGWQMLFECLSVGRGISLPALSASAGAVSYITTGAYAAIRKQFGMPIGQFEGVEEKLAFIGGFAYQLESMRTFVAQSIDLKERPAVLTSIAKYHMTEMARVVNQCAMDVHGGRAIMMGPHNYLAATYQAMPLNITVEGANILTRSLMIFGQGAIRCHPYLKEELLVFEKYADAPDLALKYFDVLGIQHITYACSNILRTVFLSVTRGKFTCLGHNRDIKSYMQKINWLSASLALVSDIIMLTLGGALKRKESLSAKLGDVLSALFLNVTLLKSYQQNNKTAQEKALLDWCISYNFHQCQEAYYDLFQNLPNRALAFLLKQIIFPFGRVFQKPSHIETHQVAHNMLTDNAIRQLFKSQCHVGTANDPIGLIEKTFQKLLIAKTDLNKLSKAIKEGDIHKTLPLKAQLQSAVKKKILTQSQAQLIEDYEVFRERAIAVDEFQTDYTLGSQ